MESSRDHHDPRVSSPPTPSSVMMGLGGPYGPGPGPTLQNNSAMSAAAAPVMHGMPLTFNQMDPPLPAVTKPMDLSSSGQFYHGQGGVSSGGVGTGGSGEKVKKKRGRPRKYGPEGSGGVGLALLPMTSAGGNGGHSGGGSVPSTEGGKRKGRPPGSGKKRQLDALGSLGTSFTPHIINVKPNEDVASKIMAFSQQGPRTTCIISANGALSNVTLRQTATSGGIRTYEGHYEIISLSGSFLLAEDGDTRSRTGGLSVALTGSDGQVIGGCVAGMLMAATPVQVVVGSFITEGKKQKEDPPKQRTSAPPQMVGFGAALPASPPSDGTSSEHFDDPGSPIGPNGSTFNNSGHHLQSAYNPVGWTLSGNQSRYDHE